jgi:hypothetical protein
MPGQEVSSSAVDIYHQFKKKNSSEILASYGITGEHNLEDGMLYWIIYNTKDYQFSETDVTFLMCDILKTYIDDSFIPIQRFLTTNSLKVLLRYDEIEFIDIGSKQGESFVIKKRELRHLPLRNNIQNLGGWINFYGKSAILDLFVHKIIRMIQFTFEMNAVEKSSFLKMITSYKPIIDDYYKNCLYRSKGKTFLALREAIVRKYASFQTKQRLIRLDSKDCSAVGTRMKVKMNPVIGIEIGNVTKSIKDNSLDDKLIVFSAIPVNIKSIIYELLFDFKTLQEKVKRLKANSNNQAFKDLLADSVAVCHKWDVDICRLLKPNLTGFLNGDGFIDSHAKNNSHLFFMFFIAVMSFLYLYLKPKKAKKRFALLNDIAKKKSLTKSKKDTINLKAKSEENKKLLLDGKFKSEGIQKNRRPKRRPQKSSSRSAFIYTRKKHNPSDKKQEMMAGDKGAEISEIKEAKIPKCFDSTLSNPQQASHHNLLPFFSHEDECNEKELNNIGKLSINQLAKIYDFCIEQELDLFIKGSNAIVPELDPKDMDLHLISSNSSKSLFTIYSTMAPLFNNDIIPNLFADTLINFEVLAQNAEREKVFDITLTRQGLSSFFSQDVLLNTTTGLRKIVKQESGSSVKMLYSCVFLPASILNDTQHTLSKAIILSSLRTRTLFLVGNTQSNIHQMIDKGEMTSCLKAFKYLYKNCIKYSKTHRIRPEAYACLLLLFNVLSNSQNLKFQVNQYLKSYYQAISFFQSKLNQNIEDRTLSKEMVLKLTDINHFFGWNQTGATPINTQLKP